MPTNRGEIFAECINLMFGHDFQIIGADYFDDFVVGGGWLEIS